VLFLLHKDRVHVQLAIYLLLRLVHDEALIALSALEHDTPLRILDDLPGVDHLAHEIGGSSVVVGCLLGLLHKGLGFLSSSFCFLDSASEVGQLCQLSFDLFLPGDLFLLLLFYLVLGPSPLAADLEHVSPDALRHYS